MNPHNWCTALDPPFTPNRRWKCNYCGAQGEYDALQEIECTYVYPPCEYCGQTPICTLDCAGIKMALATPGVVVAGGMKPVLPKA